MSRQRGAKRQRGCIAQFRMQLQSHVARLKTGFLLRVFIFSRNKYLHTAVGSVRPRQNKISVLFQRERVPLYWSD